MRYQAFVIEADADKGIEVAEAWAAQELKMKTKGNPDIVVLRHGLFSVSDARRVTDAATQAPFQGEHKVIIISASRAYHEAQNALLKIFEEPPQGTYLFFVLPSLGGLLPTLRSRVSILDAETVSSKSIIPEIAMQFVKASREKRTTVIKKFSTGKDEEERRENRDQAIEVINGVEAIVYASMRDSKFSGNRAVADLLSDISVLRRHLYDRSAPVRMILEHLSLIIPKGLV